MKTKKRILSALALSVAAAFGGTEAQAAQFSNVYVFGDSLSDAGYYRGFLASIGVPSALVSQMGRFSTNPGPIWAEIIGQYYGTAITPSNAGGTDYAQGGARVALSPGITPQGQAERPISTQITEYLSTHGNAADPNALYTVWGGANDFFVNSALLQAGQITSAQFQQNLLAAGTAEAQQIGRLFQAGAQHVMLFINFDPAMTPAASTLDAATRAGFTQLAVGVNTTTLVGLASNGLRVIPVDLFSLFNEIRANPTAFGFTNATGFACGPFPPFTQSSSALFCLVGQNVPANAENTLVWADPSGHLTTAANRIVAQFALSLVEGPYNYSALAEAPLRTRTLHVAGVNEGLAAARHSEVGRFNVFAAGGGGDFDVDAGRGNVGVSNSLEAYTVGVTVRPSEAVTLGGAVGQTRARGTFGQGMGGYRTRENTWSLFASMKLGGFYGNGVLSIADIDFADLQRNIVLGAQTRTANASAGGSNSSAFVTAGYDFNLGRLQVGPLVSFTAQDVDVDTFDESGAGSANLRIFGQKRKSEVWSVGARASMDFGRWTPWVRVTADEERRDEARAITAMPLTVAATGSSYDIPAYSVDSSYTTFAVGVRGLITNNVALSASYYNVTGRAGTSEWGAGAVVSVKF
jgi:outer membrane lipase/esterase